MTQETMKGMLSMGHLLILFTIFACIAGFDSNLKGGIARASDAGRQSIAEDSSNGIGSNHPIGDRRRGEELYNASCIVCHGSQARGGIGPRLAGNPILSNEKAFWKIVHEGRHVMPPLKGTVTEQQIADIQAWLKMLR
jgi:mono/diheme cytochrome c family protein